MKIKPFEWKDGSVAASLHAITPFGTYWIREYSITGKRFYLGWHTEKIKQFETLEDAKEFAFKHFTKRIKKIVEK